MNPKPEDWPTTERISRIGLNGGTGCHYRTMVKQFLDIPTLEEIAMANVSTAEARAAIKKLESSYVKTPESNLFFSILATAITDLLEPKEKILKKNICGKVQRISCPNPDYTSALSYLTKKEIVHAEMIGIDSNYVRRVLQSLRLLDLSDCKKAA